MRSSVVLLSVCVAGSAWAKGATKPLLDPNKVADESSVVFSVGGTDSGYWVSVDTRIMGVEKGDTARLEVRHAGKTATINCGFAESSGVDGTSAISCTDQSTLLKGAGPVEADLILHADADDKEYLLRTFKVNVKNWDGKEEWQVEPDDVLGAAYMVPQQDGNPSLRFWVASGDFSATLRCNVDGKPIGRDIEGDVQSTKEITVDIMKPKSRTYWHWSQMKFEPQWWRKQPPGNAADQYVSLSDHPGKWECQLRHGGVSVREFTFVVDKKGEVAPHPMQSAKGFPKLPPHVALIDMKIDKGNGIDERIKPDVIKKSRGFGLPWPQDDSVKAYLASLPPAYENANPVAEKAKGQVIDGAKANPPRFIDESTTYIALGREMDGYNLSLHADAYGVPAAQSNQYKLVVKQGAKVLSTIECGHNSNIDCKTADHEVLKAKGPIEAQLTVYDDNDGNTYVLRNYKVNVVHPTSFGDPVWQVLADDALGEGWIAGMQNNGKIEFRFWVADEHATNFAVRCMVDGKTKIPDFKIGGTDTDRSIEADVIAKGSGNHTKYEWQFNGADATSPDVYTGLPPKDFKPDPDRLQYLGEHPGNWDCDLRQAGGKVERKFLFHVNNKGTVDPSPDLAGELATPDVAPVDMRFGKDATDVRIRPDAIKKNAPWGRPWPKGPPKELPKASGLPDPK